MPAGTLLITRTLDRIAAIAAGVSGIGAARVHQGYRRFAEAENFDAQVAALAPETEGIFAFWFLRGGHAADASDAQFDVAGELVFRLPKDASSDGNAAIELAERLKDELLDGGNYQEGEGAPQAVRYAFAGLETVRAAGVGVFSFGSDPKAGGAMRFWGGC